MLVTLTCTTCQRSLRVREHYRGKAVRCPGCGARFLVPDTAAPAVPDGAGGRSGAAAEIDLPVNPEPAPPGPAAPPRPAGVPGALPAVAALLPLGIPLLASGGKLPWAALGVGLAAVCWALARRRRWSVGRRLTLAGALAGTGYGMVLALPLVGPRPAPGAAGAAPPPVPARMGPGDGRLMETMRGARPFPLMPAGAAISRRLDVPFPLEPADEDPAEAQDLKYHARIGELLAVAADPAGRAVFATDRGGALRQYSYPDFHPLATYQLWRPAYRAVLDGRRGLLFLAASDPQSIPPSPFGDREGGRGDLHVYDVRPLLEGKTKPGAPLQPVRILRLQASIAHLCLAPDGESLYYLAEAADRVCLGRLNPGRPELAQEVVLTGRVENLCLTPDGRTLYATRPGKVLAFDPATLRQVRQVDVDATPSDLAASDGGTVFLGEHGRGGAVTVVDMNKGGAVVARWPMNPYGPTYLKLSPDQKHLYVGSSSPASRTLRSLLLSAGLAGRRPPVTGRGISTRNGPVVGEFFLTPDGQFLINRWGKVYRLASAPSAPARPAPRSR